MKLFRRRESYGALAGALAVGAVAGVAAGAVETPAPVALAVACGAAALAYAALMRRWIARALVLRRPLDPRVRDVLARDVAFYRRLDDARRAEFERNVQVFLAEHTIAGARGAEVSLETRALVAASAVILLFGREDLDLPSHVDVVVYPDAFDDDYRVAHDARILGQVHSQGPVILSERALREGFRRAADGENVGLHEFAHLLDLEVGAFDGVPSGMPWRAASAWLALVGAEIARIERHRSVLRQYGATNEAEFFAVAVEGFFERPEAMRAKHPKLYAALRDYLGQDPAAEPRERPAAAAGQGAAAGSA